MPKSVARWVHRRGASRAETRNLNRQLLELQQKELLQRSKFRGIADLPDEILVIIFELVLADNKYNATLLRVCSRWTRLIYRFVYVNGFVMQDLNPEISRLLLPLVSSIENSEFASILTLSSFLIYA